jgi:hypothetical protein
MQKTKRFGVIEEQCKGMTRIKKGDPAEAQANLNAVVVVGVLGGLGLVLLMLLLIGVAIFR